MSFLDALQNSASGLSAQRLRMNLISSNLANVNTTRTEQGGPYKRKEAVFAAVPQRDEFTRTLADRLDNGVSEVRIAAILDDNRPPIRKLDPDHPDADAQGFVNLPNINIVEEMVNMISASRSYEANVTAIDVTKEMASNALDIGR